MDSAYRKKYLYLLAFFLFLFCLRVVGQVLVAFCHVTFLPPMKEWYSGLMPYEYLLPSQIAIIILFGKVCWDLGTAKGYFAKSQQKLGKLLYFFSIGYASFMVLRYIVHMTIHPDQRWFGGTIPIIFHIVLASFIFTYSRFQLNRSK